MDSFDISPNYPALLVPRLFTNTSGEDPENCNLTLYYEQTPTEPIVGDWMFYQFNMLLSGLCCLFSTLLILFLMVMHTLHFSKPKEQLEIMRICLLIPVYSCLTFIAVCEANAWVFVKPWIEVAQGYALANYWILVCRFLAPENYDYKTLFYAPMTALNTNKAKRGKKLLTIRKYRRHWFYIIQGPIVMILIAVGNNIVEVMDHFCLLENANLIRVGLTSAYIASMAAAMVTAIRHSATLRTELWPYRAMFKMLSFKLLLGLYIILEIIYMILDNVPTSPYHNENPQLSTPDLEVGIPLMATSCELVLFAIFFYYAYSVTPYRVSKAEYFELGSDDQLALRNADHTHTYQGGRFGQRAWWQMLNHHEMKMALKFPFAMLDDLK